MKSVLLLTLLVCLVVSALPVTAQEKTETPASFDRRGPATAGPLARSIRVEASRLAVAGESAPSGFEALQQGDRRGDGRGCVDSLLERRSS
jgi:hypothetical protein